MDEHLKRHYVREEEFLDEFANVAWAAVRCLDGAWSPDTDCDHNARVNQKYFLDIGELDRLVFERGSVFHNSGGFSAAQIVLRSTRSCPFAMASTAALTALRW